MSQEIKEVLAAIDCLDKAEVPTEDKDEDLYLV